MSRIIGIIIGMLLVLEDNFEHRIYGGILVIGLTLGYLINKWVDDSFSN